MSRDRDLIGWALSVPIPSNRQIGSDKARVVLIALCRYESADGRAWPSAETLAADVHGMDRRRVRQALDALETAGLIIRDGRVSRAICWRLAGIPANQRAGVPAATPVGEVAGEMAGEKAGEPAGIPATKRSEGNTTSSEEEIPAMMHHKKPSPRAEALALLEPYHGERAADALAAVERQYRQTRGEGIARPDRYLARWSPDQLAAIHVPRSSNRPTPVEQCQRCDPAGWIVNVAGDPMAKCSHEPTVGAAHQLGSVFPSDLATTGAAQR